METNMVTTHDGQQISLSDAVELTYGEHANEWANKADPDLITLRDNSYCLMGDSYTIIDAICYHEDQYDEYDIVYNESSNEYDFAHNLTHGIIDSSRNRGYFDEAPAIFCQTDDEYYINQRVANSLGIYEYGDEGEWFREDDEDRPGDDDERLNAGYHSNVRKFMGTDDTVFTVGVEVEKEDANAKKIRWSPLYMETGWAKEDDGSLEYGGYELVSPTYDLMTDDLMTAVEGSAELQTLINGTFSDRCGGHIHIGNRDMKGMQLFDKMCGYLPFLYSIYDRRAKHSYCAAYPKDRLKDRPYGYPAVRILENRLEIRLFPAVRDINNLKWRLDLLRIMMTVEREDPAAVVFDMLDSSSRLHNHLRKLYSVDTILDRAARAVKWCNKLENTNLNIDMMQMSLKNKQEGDSMVQAS